MRKAFTLAEVLITLGIIGVVAAMTIPTLVTNYQKKDTVVKLRKAISVLNNGVKLMMAHEGVYAYNQLGFHSCWDGLYGSQDAEVRRCINSYFTPHFKISKYAEEDLDESYYPYTSVLMHNGNNLRLAPLMNLGAYYGFMTQDGIMYWPFGFNWEATVDVNGVQAPNQIGRDIFILQEDNGHFSVNGLKTWNDESNNNDYCGDNNVGNGYGCSGRIMAEDWKINY